MTHAIACQEEKLCTELKGVGTVLGARLAEHGMRTLRSLLFYFPYRYRDDTRIFSIADLQENDEVTLKVKIISSRLQIGRRMQLICQVEDETGTMQLRFFHYVRAHQQKLTQGTWIYCHGKVRAGLDMIHPRYTLEEKADDMFTDYLTPIYSQIAGVPSYKFTQLMSQAVDYVDEIFSSYDGEKKWYEGDGSNFTIPQALRLVHRAPADSDIALFNEGQHAAQKRLIADELLAYQMSYSRLRHAQQQRKAPSLLGKDTWIKKFIENLPYCLTAAQERVTQEISQDLKRDKPMLRLLQGDVGAGKTVVAAMVALQALSAGHQVALMVPTELLAEQHYVNLKKWFEPLGQSVHYLSGQMSTRERQAVLDAMRGANPMLIVGTHALFQKKVEFAKLALIIIDEQHRFGVEQRFALSEKGSCEKYCPHQLLMTATPIPRTLAMTSYASVDISTLNELPPGRLTVQTVVFANNKRDSLIQRLQQIFEEGHQVYWVCPLIETSDILNCQAAEESAVLLRESFPDRQIALVHGRMASQDKNETMRQFKKGVFNLLVATTVIEVGVDVPNANVMVIENAERLGLAQLHQLRGRVGRGAEQAYCILLYQTPLSKMAKERLETMRHTHDGFVLAEKDLALRGPGEMLGTRQTGRIDFKIADLKRDEVILQQVHEIALSMLAQHPKLANIIMDRWLPDQYHFS